MYSTLEEDLEIVLYFFDFQQMRDSLIYTLKSVTDLRVSEQSTQLESLKAFNCSVD